MEDTLKPILLVSPETIPAEVSGPVCLRLAAGRYTRDLHIRGPGVVVEPAMDGEIEWWRNTITADHADCLCISGLTFRQSPTTTLVINGPCRGAVVTRCHFFACGTGGAVTVWLGEGTHDCRIEDCEFDLLGLLGAHALRPSHTHSIGIMTAEQDCTGHIIARNQISHYDYGIQLGVNGTCETEGRHWVKDNTIIAPRTDGIHVKAGACRIEGNRVVGARAWSISARAGHHSVFQGNTIEDGYIGMNIRGRSHRVIENTFIRVRAQALLLLDAKSNGDGFAAEDTEVHGNQFIDCGGADAGQPVITACGLDGPPLPDSKGIVITSPLPQRVGENTEDRSDRMSSGYRSNAGV